MIGFKELMPQFHADTMFLPVDPSTLEILMAAAWIYRCEECDAPIDGDELVCDACWTETADDWGN